MNKLLFLITLLFSTISVTSQIWEDNLLKTTNQPSASEKFEAFENYRAIHPYTKGNGYKPYAREMDFVNERVITNSTFNPNSLFIEWQKEKEKYNNAKSRTSANWVSKGPINTPIILSNNKKRGNGRVNCIAFDPLDEDII